MRINFLEKNAIDTKEEVNTLKLLDDPTTLVQEASILQKSLVQYQIFLQAGDHSIGQKVLRIAATLKHERNSGLHAGLYLQNQ